MNKALNVLIVLIIMGFIGYKIYKNPKFGEGQNAPDFEMEMFNGDPFKLSDLRGNYVLLDFWGSWCGPCRKDNKNLVKLYREYNHKTFKHGGGFEIVSVAVENDYDRWFSAMVKDQLIWPYHIVLLERFNSPLAKLYGIKEIPTKYLLGPGGNILGTNLSYDETTAILDENLQ